jgi:hypothetical protein
MGFGQIKKAVPVPGWQYRQVGDRKKTDILNYLVLTSHLRVFSNNKATARYPHFKK